MYDTNKTWYENIVDGPSLSEDALSNAEIEDMRSKLKPCKMFLGKLVASPIGIASGPLLDSRWVEVACKLGYSVLVYKTIRSYKHDGHPLPNMVCLEDGSYTNSFGMPSMDNDYLKKDIPKAYEIVKKYPGTALIISITGDDVSDFVKTASFAVECGAEFIEINMSCPNVGDKHVSLYKDPSMIRDVVSKIRNTVGDKIPIIIKVGCYGKDTGLMKQVFFAAYEAGANAISGINGIQRNVDVLGEDRKVSGVCGKPLYPHTKDFVYNARQIINRYGLDDKLTLIAVGGVTDSEQVDELITVGADFVQIASGFITGKHNLMMDWVKKHTIPELPDNHPLVGLSKLHKGELIF